MGFKNGDWVKIPKGTPVKQHHYGDYNPSSRDVVVQPSVHEIYGWRHSVLTEDDREAWHLESVENRGPADQDPHITGVNWSAERAEEWRKGELAIEAKYKAIATERAGGTLDELHWGEGKICSAQYGVLAEAPAPRKKSEPKINKRQQMVKGSKWKLTEDVDLTFNISNPAIEVAMNVWDSKNPRSSPTHQAWYANRQAERKRLENTIGKYIVKTIRNCKTGEVFTVTQKFRTYSPYDIMDKTAGAVAIIQFDGDADEIAARYKQLEPLIEADAIPTVDVYVLRNKTTGLYFKSTEYNEAKTKAAQKAKGTKWGIWHEHAVYDAIFVDNFMKAKHYDAISRAKSSILEATGYYYELPGSENLPEWMGHAASFDFTQDYELVKFDKLGRKEVETIDLWDWYQNAWRLRELTVKYGSSVRSCYKELEKKNLLDEQSGVIVFTASEDAVDRAYGDRSALTDEDREEINRAITVAGLKKGKYKRGEDHKSVAVSFPNKGAALMFKLSYGGTLKATVIDLQEMKEVVEATA